MRIRGLFVLIPVALLVAACGSDDAPGTADTLPPAETAPVDTLPIDTTPVDSGPTVTTPDEPSTPADELAAARQRWVDTDLASYRMTVRELCFCPETVWTDTIVDGEVVEHDTALEEVLYDPGPRTMTSLFDDVDAVINAGYFTFDAQYDAETGALIEYFVDIDEAIADEEHGVAVTLETLDT